MTVSNTTNVAQFTGDGVAKSFPFTFRIFKTTDLVVMRRSVSGTSTPLVLNTDYTVSGSGSLNGGTVTTTAALATGELLTIARVLSVQQLTDLRNQGDYFAEIHEDVFDYLTMLIQQIAEGDSRALKHPRDKEHYQAEGRRIADLEDPVDDQDAATGVWVKRFVGGVLQAGQGPVNNASNVLFVGQNGSTITNVQALSSSAGSLLGWRGRPIGDALLTIPEHYGAKGDGVTDDSDAFQAAINSLPQFGRLNLKQGSVYKLAKGVEVRTKGVTLDGEGGKIYYPKTAFSYLHCFRVYADDVTIQGMYIYSDTSLVRDDTGFAISIDNANNTLVVGNWIEAVASAAIWLTNAYGARVSDNYIAITKADGIHFSDGCQNFTCTGNALTQVEDDAIAVVGDVPGDNLVPSGGTVSGNTIDGTKRGHGIALIACQNINVTGNTIRSTGYAGIGSYFWNLTGEPLDQDWVNDCLIEGNIIYSPGERPSYADNCCGILAGTFRRTAIRNNKISAGILETYGPSCGIRVLTSRELFIEGNEIRDSASYGVWSPDTNASGVSKFNNLTVSGNKFYNIAKEAVRINPQSPQGGNIGSVYICRNDLQLCSYSADATSAIYVAKTGTSRLVMSGNTNLDNGKLTTYDAVSCTNVVAADNTPETVVEFSPAASPTGGAWTTSTSSGRYCQRGGLIYFTVNVTVTTVGTGTGLKFNLPKTLRGGTQPFIFTGRETALTGKTLTGFPISTAQASMFMYDNSNPITGNGAAAQISGWYMSA